MKTNTAPPPSFDAIIQAGRKKRKNEDLASQILGSNSSLRRGKNSSQARRSLGPDRSLASRIGVSKRSVSAPRGPRLQQQSGSAWSQARKSNDNARLLRRSQHQQSAGWGRGDGGDGYGSTITATAGRGRSGLNNETGQGKFDDDRGSELSIRGMAGPYTVVASNFAPGTTAADISAVMEPVGGEMLSCHLVSSNPTVIVEMVFSERDGADNVVAMFNNKRADGRLLYVYLKVGAPHKFQQGTTPRTGSGVSGSFRQDSDLMDTSYDPPSQPRSGMERSREPGLQDGRYGFSDIESRGKANTGRIRSDQGLFSDRMVQRNQNYRR